MVRNDNQGMAIAFSKALDAGSEASLRHLIYALGDETEAPLKVEAGRG